MNQPRPQETQTPSSSKPALPPNLSAPVPPFHFERGKEPVSAQECGWIRRRSRPQLSPDRSRRPRPPNRRRHRLGCLLVGAAASTGTTLRAPRRCWATATGRQTQWNSVILEAPTATSSLTTLDSRQLSRQPSSFICHLSRHDPVTPSPSLAASAWPQKHAPIHDVSSRRRAAATVIDRHRHRHPSQSPGRLPQEACRWAWPPSLEKSRRARPSKKRPPSSWLPAWTTTIRRQPLRGCLTK